MGALFSLPPPLFVCPHDNAEHRHLCTYAGGIGNSLKAAELALSSLPPSSPHPAAQMQRIQFFILPLSPSILNH